MAIVYKLEATVAVMKRKSYDWLDQQQTQFDTDFEEFQQQMEELHVSFLFYFSVSLLLFDVWVLMLFNEKFHLRQTLKLAFTEKRDHPAAILCPYEQFLWYMS